ncbi:MAG: glycerol-3-phosphate acyltransferase, partial [Paracoccaceae bacterium]
EGGLSLDGRVGPPKLGLLNYIVTDFEPGKSRDVVFVPVALNYDRVLEDRVLLAAANATERKFRFRWRDAVRYFFKHIYQRLTGRFLRYGYAAVSFGAPLSLASFTEDKEGDLTADIGRELMARIRAIVPVLPIPLVAACLLKAGRSVSRAELVERVTAQVAKMAAAGAHVELFNGDIATEVENAVNHLLMRQLVDEVADGVQVAGEHGLLQYYANSIAHLLDAPAA